MQKHILRADRTPRAVCSDGPNSKDWRISLLLSRLQRLSVTRTFSEAVSVRRRGWRAQMHVKKNFNIKLGRSVALKVLTWWTQTYIEDDILVFFFFLINEELGPVGIWLGRKWGICYYLPFIFSIVIFMITSKDYSPSCVCILPLRLDEWSPKHNGVNPGRSENSNHPTQCRNSPFSCV